VAVTGWAELRDAGMVWEDRDDREEREAIGVAFELFLDARCFEQSSTLSAVKLVIGQWRSSEESIYVPSAFSSLPLPASG
jgi:hypothetical protein